MRTIDWKYGETVLEQGDIESLDEWSDDKEMAYGIMDSAFDYLWNEDCDRIHFIDRLYACNIEDEMTESRKENGTLELWFDSYDEVFKWILDHSIESDDEWYFGWFKERIEQIMKKDTLT